MLSLVVSYFLDSSLCTLFFFLVCVIPLRRPTWYGASSRSWSVRIQPVFFFHPSSHTSALVFSHVPSLVIRPISMLEVCPFVPKEIPCLTLLRWSNNSGAFKRVMTVCSTILSTDIITKYTPVFAPSNATARVSICGGVLRNQISRRICHTAGYWQSVSSPGLISQLTAFRSFSEAL